MRVRVFVFRNSRSTLSKLIPLRNSEVYFIHEKKGSGEC